MRCSLLLLRGASRASPCHAALQPAGAGGPRGAVGLLQARSCAAPAGAGERSAPATSSSQRVVLQAPGAQPANAAAFARRLAETTANGEVAETFPVDVASRWRCLRALALPAEPAAGASDALDFEVRWVSGVAPAPAAEADNAGAGHAEQGTRLQLLVQAAAIDHRAGLEPSQGFYVANTTQVVQLAKKLALELQQHESVLVHTWADAKTACSVMLQALATTQQIGNLSLKCTAAFQEGPKTPVKEPPSGDAGPQRGTDRLLVQARKVAKELDEGMKGLGEDFIAYPPKADEQVPKFDQSVHQRLGFGQAVVMECRGWHATRNAVLALATVKTRAAVFEVRPSGGSSVRSLRIRAVRGPTWERFNSTDFTRTNRLKAGETSDIKVLARALGAEVKKLGAVALHAFADVHGSVSNALLALAFVPQEAPGLEVRAIASLGVNKGGGTLAGRRTLRLYVMAPGRDGKLMPTLRKEE